MNEFLILPIKARGTERQAASRTSLLQLKPQKSQIVSLNRSFYAGC
jgi:hypothetical protein